MIRLLGDTVKVHFRQTHLPDSVLSACCTRATPSSSFSSMVATMTNAAHSTCLPLLPIASRTGFPVTPSTPYRLTITCAYPKGVNEQSHPQSKTSSATAFPVSEMLPLDHFVVNQLISRHKSTPSGELHSKALMFLRHHCVSPVVNQSSEVPTSKTSPEPPAA